MGQDLRIKIEKSHKDRRQASEAQIVMVMRRRAQWNGGLLTPRQVNAALWRNYRLKIPQVTMLFEVGTLQQVAQFGAEGSRLVCVRLLRTWQVNPVGPLLGVSNS